MICIRGIMLLGESWKMIDSWIMFGMFVLCVFVWMVLGWLKGMMMEQEKGNGFIENETERIIVEDVLPISKMMKEQGISELEISTDGFRVVLQEK